MTRGRLRWKIALPGDLSSTLRVGDGTEMRGGCDPKGWVATHGEKDCTADHGTDRS